MLKIIKDKFINILSDKRFYEILTGSAWTFAALVISAGLTLLTSIFTARVYGADILGVVAMVTSLLSLLSVLTVLGTNTSILRLIPEHMAKYSATSAFRVYRKTQCLVLAVSVLVGILLFLSSDFISNKVFLKPQLSIIFSLSAFFLVFLSIVNLSTEAIRGMRMVKIFALMKLIPTATKLVVLILSTFLFFDQYNPIYALFASYSITALAGLMIIHIGFKKKMRETDVVKEMGSKEIIIISLPMVMAAAMSLLIGQIGVLVLGMFRTEAEVGYYDIAVKLATLTSFILNSVNTIAAPKFSEYFFSNKMNDLFYVAQRSAKLIFYSTVPILVILIILGKPMLGIFGNNFLSAYGALILLVIGQFINSISGPTAYFMNMTGNQKAFRNIILITAMITVALSFSLIPFYGILGAAFSGMLSLILWNFSALFFIKKKYGVFIGYFPFIN